jgi:hypothetical protein
MIRLLPAKEALGRLRRDRSVRASLFAFMLSRAIVLVLLVLGAHVSLITTFNTSMATRDFELDLRKVRITQLIRKSVQAADINWYTDIAEYGYDKRPFDASVQRNWAFFPLFPLLLRWASKITGEYLITGMLLSNIFFLVALVLLHKTAREFGLDEATADRTVFYIAIFPTSFFFSLPLTESLFLLLSVSSFYCAKRKRWWLAGLLGALASATRVTGILLLPALALIYWQTYRSDCRRKEIFSLLLIPTGLLSFMAYLYLITGNPLAFKDVLVLWGRTTGFFLMPLVRYMRDPLLIAIPWDLKVVNFAAAVLALISGVWLLKRREYALAVYTLASVLLALSSSILQSQARYALVVFPIFMVLAMAGRRDRVDQLIRAVSLALLSLMTALFAAHFSIAMS